MAVRIGELLLKEKRITPEQLQEALNYQRQNGGKLGYNLIKLGYVKDEEITALLSKQYGVPSIALTQFEIDPSVVKLRGFVDDIGAEGNRNRANTLPAMRRLGRVTTLPLPPLEMRCAPSHYTGHASMGRARRGFAA